MQQVTRINQVKTEKRELDGGSVSIVSAPEAWGPAHISSTHTESQAWQHVSELQCWGTVCADKITLDLTGGPASPA